MQQRRLGGSGLMVAPPAFGGNVFGRATDENTSFALPGAFVEAGCNLVDTADAYSCWVGGGHAGESETVIGKGLKRSPGKRRRIVRIVLATKVGKEMGEGRISQAPGELAGAARLQFGARMLARRDAASA